MQIKPIDVRLQLLFGRDKIRSFIASQLYQATYSDKWNLRPFLSGESASPQEILDEFCEMTFAASYEEVVKAWDKFLG